MLGKIIQMRSKKNEWKVKYSSTIWLSMHWNCDSWTVCLWGIQSTYLSLYSFVICPSTYLYEKNMARNELALYTSFEEEIEENCILCGTAENKPLDLGKKVTFGEITVHHFCLVSSTCNSVLLFEAWCIILICCEQFSDIVG